LPFFESSSLITIISIPDIAQDNRWHRSLISPCKSIIYTVMKKLLLSALLLGSVALFSSCGVNYSMILNHNVNNTQVQLSSNNFKVIDKITGSASTFYIIGFGDMNRTKLYQEAYAAMMDKANLKDGARAVINVVSEEHVGGVPPFYVVRTITVSGNVIEFTR
jgi:hypothetical protein